MAQIQADGITDLIVFNQGGQYSKVTQGINVREVSRYLDLHPEYKPRVTIVRSFSGVDAGVFPLFSGREVRISGSGSKILMVC